MNKTISEELKQWYYSLELGSFHSAIITDYEENKINEIIIKIQELEEHLKHQHFSDECIVCQAIINTEIKFKNNLIFEKIEKEIKKRKQYVIKTFPNSKIAIDEINIVEQIIKEKFK